MKNDTTIVIDKDRLEVMITRRFEAPRMMLWAAMTDPVLIPCWWGPRELTTTVEKLDLKPDGEWRFIQKDASGKEFGFHGVTKSIVPLERIVQTFNFEGIPPGHEVVQTMMLKDGDGDTTELTQIAQYKTLDDLEGMIQSGMESGMRESMDRLAELTNPKKELTLVRVFDAPRELVWKAWTDPKLMAEWWGPTGFSNPLCEVDARPGGAIRIEMKPPGGPSSPMGGIFKEVVPPERLVFTATAFFDEKGENPGLENLNTITFEEAGKGKTKVTLKVTVLKFMPAFKAPLSGMEMGWRQSFEKLAVLVTSRREG